MLCKKIYHSLHSDIVEQLKDGFFLSAQHAVNEAASNGWQLQICDFGGSEVTRNVRL